jgi:hypothetical protein
MQTPEHHDREQHENLLAPPRLVSALLQVSKPRIFIPRTLDEAILKAANQHLVPRKEPKPLRLRLCTWFAAAAALFLALAVIPHLLRKSGPSPSAGRFVLEDVNHDGKVDILDAFALARQLKARAPNSHLDINGDGVVDERDVTTLAVHAVKLEKGGS